MKLSILLLLISIAMLVSEAARFDPYEVLGVHRRDSVQTIKKAYKNLAKIWHPDKNSDKSAGDRFIEITKAYEILSDPDRRRKFDNHGITEDTPNFNQRHDYSRYGRFDDPFESFFDDVFAGNGGGGRGFRYSFGGGGGGGGGGGSSGGSENRIFHKQSITAKAYWNTVLPNSEKQPYLILFYSDWCFTCLRIEPIWSRLSEELEPVGFGIATIHAEHERELTRKVGSNELPHMVLVMDKKVIHYKDPQFSAIKALEFVRRKFPYKLVELIDDSNVDAFLNGWMDNRVRVLMFGHTDLVRLRFMTAAFRFRYRTTVGYVKLHDPNAKKLIRNYGVSQSAHTDTILLFQEDPDIPVASASMKDLSLNTIIEVMEANQFLQLPRLSNQKIFDKLCPAESARTRKRLCVTLFTREDPKHEDYRRAMREFMHEFKFSPERVRFSYVLTEKQSDFVNSLADLQDPDLRVAILWRREHDKLKYELLKHKWEISPENRNVSIEELRTTLQRLLSANEVLPYEAEIKELFDEHAQGLFVRIANRIIEMLETMRESVTKDEILPAVSLVVTVGFIFVGGYVMNYLVKMEEESVQRQLGAKGLKVDKKGKVVPELKIHELRAETYNGMVRLLKPGCRTIVLIVDKESKEKLVPKFYQMAWPYRKNKTLMFGFIYIEKGLAWFKKILNLTLPEPRDITINPKNCIGTVLSLNGHRRYFCMYHAKHPEGSRKRIYTANNGSVAGAFMGLDSEFDEDDSNNSDELSDLECQREIRNRKNLDLLDSQDHLPIFEDQLLDGLQMWLDRLFEGSTFRYHINYWPEFPISPATFTR